MKLNDVLWPRVVKISSYEVLSNHFIFYFDFLTVQRYTYRALQRIQIELTLLSVWAEPAALGSAKTALKFK